MKFSKATDYALHALVYMIHRDGETTKIPVQDLSLALNVSTTYLSKVLTRIVKANYISSTSGAKGGYRLQQNWENVSLYDIVVAIDGVQTLFEDSFDHGEECRIQAAMMEAQENLINTLKNKKLKELTA